MDGFFHMIGTLFIYVDANVWAECPKIFVLFVTTVTVTAVTKRTKILLKFYRLTFSIFSPLWALHVNENSSNNIYCTHKLGFSSVDPLSREPFSTRMKR